jgi:putative membrane protein
MKKTIMLTGLLLAPVSLMAYGGRGYGGCLYGSPGFFGFGGGSVMWILIIALIIIFGVFGLRALRNNTTGVSKKNDALEILKERFARGEITRDEFLEMKKDLG